MVNIVMLVRNRYKLLEQAIRSLNLHTPRHSWTLTIVDDGSDDFRVLKAYKYSFSAKTTQVLKLECTYHVIAQLKNIGVAASENFFGRGDYLYISDCDVYFTEGWLDKLIQLYEAAYPLGFSLIGGQCHPFHQPINKPPLQLFPVQDPPQGMTEHSVLDGPSWLMDWDTWNKCGPFGRENAPGPCQSEEYPFCERVLKAGFRIGAANPPLVIHTGITQTDGKEAPGAKERLAMRVPGVLYE